MDRSNVNRYLGKLKSSIRTRRNRAANSGPVRTRMGTGKKVSLLIVVSVLACMVLTVFSTMARRDLGGSASDVEPPLRGLIGQPSDVDSMFNAYGTDEELKANITSGNTTGSDSATEAAAPASGPAAPTAQNWDRMIIRTATLQLKVEDVPESLDKVRALAGTHGGYIASSDSHIEGEYTVATLTLQVPAAQFDDAMIDLRKVGVTAIGETISSSDVTEEFTDLESQLRNLKATEGRIQAIMAKAERIEDILTLDRELRQIQSEIERIQGRTNYLSKRAEMSSITVTLYPEIAVVEPVRVSNEGWNPGRIAAEAWNASLEMLSGVATVAITVAVFMWWAIPLLLLALWLALRPRRDIASGSTSSPTPDAA